MRLESSQLLFLLPIFVLLFTRIGIELSVLSLPLAWAWLPSFATYYLAIVGSLLFARKRLGIPISTIGKVSPLPSIRFLLIGFVLPALLPLGVFLLNVQYVPVPLLLSIILFALINPWFEDAFWRGLLANLPLPSWGRIVLSAALFSFSHYFLWGAYWLAKPHILIPTCATTFIMGVCWMWFYQRDRRLIYPILSHILVDVFNLSIAIFMGVWLPTVY